MRKDKFEIIKNMHSFSIPDYEYSDNYEEF